MTDRVLVLGAGRMGMPIGLEYAMAGFSVHLLARDLTSLKRRFIESVDRWGQLIPADKPSLDTLSERIKFTTQIDLTWQPDIIVESLPEDMRLKRSVLKPVVSSYREAIVATNTSSLDITSLAASINAPIRTIGVHYLNPPYLNPLVEIIPAKETSSKTQDRIVEVIRSVGKSPILVQVPLPGFARNRLQFALLREAVNLVEEGVVTPEEIDLIMELGLGRRWRAVGPFKSVMLGGTSTFVAAAPHILKSLNESHELDGLSRIVDELDFSMDDAIRARDWLLASDLQSSKSSEGS